jgi:hypothetical protein
MVVTHNTIFFKKITTMMETNYTWELKTSTRYTILFQTFFFISNHLK